MKAYLDSPQIYESNELNVALDTRRARSVHQSSVWCSSRGAHRRDLPARRVPPCLLLVCRAVLRVPLRGAADAAPAVVICLFAVCRCVEWPCARRSARSSYGVPVPHRQRPNLNQRSESVRCSQVFTDFLRSLDGLKEPDMPPLTTKTE
jgi:hypothetical protein